MQPVNFPQANLRLLGPLGENDPNILPLPVYNDGRQSISCWQLTDEELAEVQRTGVIWFCVVAGKSAPPILPLVNKPFNNSAYYHHTFYYWSRTGSERIEVWNALDENPPLMLERDKKQFVIGDKKPVYHPNKPMSYGDLYIGMKQEKRCLVMKLKAGLETWEPIPKDYYAPTDRNTQGISISNEQKIAEIKDILEKTDGNANQISARNIKNHEEKEEILRKTDEFSKQNHDNQQQEPE